MNASRLWTVAALMVAIGGASFAAASAQGKTPANVPLSQVKWEPYAPGNPLMVGRIWGDRTKGPDYAMYLKMPAGFEAGMHSHTADYHGITIQGTWVHTNQGGKPVELGVGGYVMQPGKQVHNDSCKGATECILFIHQHGAGDFIPAK